MAGSKRQLSTSLEDLLIGFDADAPPGDLSWRVPRLSDWELRIGSKHLRTYSVHTAVLGDGARCSHVLQAQFMNWGSGDRVTSLNDLLPELCWPAFEKVLDFAYTGVTEFAPETAVLIFKVAHVLRMQILAERVVKFMQACLREARCGPIILAHALQLQPGLDSLVKLAQGTVAAHFDSYGADELNPFPFETVAELLALDCLCAAPSSISRTVTAFVCANHARAGFDRLSSFVDKPRPEDAVFLLGTTPPVPHVRLEPDIAPTGGAEPQRSVSERASVYIVRISPLRGY